MIHIFSFNAMSWNDGRRYRRPDYQDLLLREHHRVLDNRDKSDCDIKVICQDGDIYYTRLLFFFMQPDLRYILKDCEDDMLVIFYPSLSVHDIIKFYEVGTTNSPSHVIEMPPTPEDQDTHFSFLLPPIIQDSINIKDQNIEPAFNHQCESIKETNKSNGDGLCCEKCGMAFKTLKQLKKHQWDKHTPSIHKCTQCSKEFRHKSELTKHMFKHMEATFVCNTCNKAFKRRNELVVHHKMFHDSSMNLYKCPQCPLTFRTESNQRRHMSVHTGNKFKCTHCDASFSRKDSYKRHLKLHN